MRAYLGSTSAQSKTIPGGRMRQHGADLIHGDDLDPPAHPLASFSDSVMAFGFRGNSVQCAERITVCGTAVEVNASSQALWST